MFKCNSVPLLLLYIPLQYLCELKLFEIHPQPRGVELLHTQDFSRCSSGGIAKYPHDMKTPLQANTTSHIHASVLPPPANLQSPSTKAILIMSKPEVFSYKILQLTGAANVPVKTDSQARLKQFETCANILATQANYTRRTPSSPQSSPNGLQLCKVGGSQATIDPSKQERKRKQNFTLPGPRTRMEATMSCFVWGEKCEHIVTWKKVFPFVKKEFLWPLKSIVMINLIYIHGYSRMY